MTKQKKYNLIIRKDLILENFSGGIELKGFLLVSGQACV